MKAIVHIGQPKTGTSSIQRFLQKNRAGLAAQGVRYSRQNVRRGSQTELAMAALLKEGVLLKSEAQRIRYKAVNPEMARRTYGDIFADLGKWPDKYDQPLAVFSSEYIMPWLNSAALITAMDTELSKTFEHVTYLVYLRRPEDLIVSRFSQNVKNGGTIGLDGFFERQLRTTSQFQALERWRKIVGHERLNVRLMQLDFLVHGDLLTDFCHVCGVDRGSLSDIVRVNESLTATGAEVLRALNKRIPALRPQGGGNPLRRHLPRYVGKLTADGPKLALTPDMAARAAEVYAESNEQVRETYFPDREWLFPRYEPTSALDRAKVHADAMDAMAHLIVKLRMNEISPLRPWSRLRAVRSDADTTTPETPSRPKAAPTPQTQKT